MYLITFLFYFSPPPVDWPCWWRNIQIHHSCWCWGHYQPLRLVPNKVNMPHFKHWSKPFLWISVDESSQIYWAKEGRSNVSHLTKNGEFIVDNATLDDAGKNVVYLGKFINMLSLIIRNIFLSWWWPYTVSCWSYYCKQCAITRV